MKITTVTPSPEPCVEAGWQAFRYYLEQPVSRQLILALRPLGALVFLETLAKPFFKVENEHYIVKGLLNDGSIRVAVHSDHLDEQQRIRQVLESFSPDRK